MSYSFDLVLDLMVSETGKVKILEFQDADRSGFSGYQKSYGANMRDRMAEYYRSQKNQRYVIRNAFVPPLFKAICDNKAIQSTFAYPLFPSIFPRQKTYAYLMGESVQEDIREVFPGAERLVVKVPDAAHGDGVFFMDAQDMRINGIDEERELTLFGSFLCNDLPLAMPSQGHVVVQEAVTPREVNISGEIYAPTIRTAMTVLWDPGNDRGGLPEIHIHGSYYKLPLPKTKEGSFAPAYLKSNVHSGLGAARIECADADAIEHQVPHAVQEIFKFCSDHNYEELCLRTLEAGDPGDIVSTLLYIRNLSLKGYSFSSQFQVRCADLISDIKDEMPFALHIFKGMPRHQILDGVGSKAFPSPSPEEFESAHAAEFERFNKKTEPYELEIKKFDRMKDIIRQAANQNFAPPTNRRIPRKQRRQYEEKCRARHIREQFKAAGVSARFRWMAESSAEKSLSFIDRRGADVQERIDDEKYRFDQYFPLVDLDLRMKKIKEELEGIPRVYEQKLVFAP